jgi:hypothetical protein
MPSRRTYLGAAMLGLAFFGPNGRLAAQAEATQLPASLVTALLVGNRAGTAGSGHYYVGVLPPGFPASLSPAAPAVVVGGTTSGPQLVVVFADTTRRFLASYLKGLEDSGWVQPVMESTGGFQSGGDGRYSFYCHEGSRVSAMAVPGAPFGAYVQVTYQKIDINSCVNRRTMATRVSELVLPSLLPPTGTETSSSRSGGGSNEQSAQTHMTATSLPPAAIAAHYAAQLIAAGWTASSPASSEKVAAQQFDARDRDGKAWGGALVVVVVGSDRDVTLSMHRVE